MPNILPTDITDKKVIEINGIMQDVSGIKNPPDSDENTVSLSVGYIEGMCYNHATKISNTKINNYVRLLDATTITITDCSNPLVTQYLNKELTYVKTGTESGELTPFDPSESQGTWVQYSDTGTTDNNIAVKNYIPDHATMSHNPGYWVISVKGHQDTGNHSPAGGYLYQETPSNIIPPLKSNIFSGWRQQFFVTPSSNNTLVTIEPKSIIAGTESSYNIPETDETTIELSEGINITYTGSATGDQPGDTATITIDKITTSNLKLHTQTNTTEDAYRFRLIFSDSDNTEWTNVGNTQFFYEVDEVIELNNTASHNDIVITIKNSNKGDNYNFPAGYIGTSWTNGSKVPNGDPSGEDISSFKNTPVALLKKMKVGAIIGTRQYLLTTTSGTSESVTTALNGKLITDSKLLNIVGTNTAGLREPKHGGSSCVSTSDKTIPLVNAIWSTTDFNTSLISINNINVDGSDCTNPLNWAWSPSWRIFDSTSSSGTYEGFDLRMYSVVNQRINKYVPGKFNVGITNTINSSDNVGSINIEPVICSDLISIT